MKITEVNRNENIKEKKGERKKFFKCQPLVTCINRQEWTEQTGSDKNRQHYISDIENYCIIKKFIYQVGNLEVRNRQFQTGSDRNRQEYISNIENYCIIIIAS